MRAKKATAAEILDGVERYVQDRAGEDPKFTMYPKTWLHNGHWADEYPQKTNRPNRRMSAAEQVQVGLMNNLRRRGLA
jgi:hypothetical protein